jgi:aminopeptidase 2
MENWGLITGRTTSFLYDPEKSSLAAKKRVAVVQAHEVSKGGCEITPSELMQIA